MTETAKKRIPAVTVAAGLAIALILGFYFLTAHNLQADTAADAEATENAEAKNAEGTDAADDEDGEAEEPEKTPIPVEAAEIRSGRISSYISATANLVPENEVRVLAESEGRVARLHVEEGDSVKRGDVLAELDRRDAEIAVEKAKIRARTDRLAFERAQKLRDQELLAPEEFDKVALGYEIAAQELAEAEWRLEKTYIRAPFAGHVTERMLQPGQHVRPGDQLFSIADFEPLVARIYLPERDVLALDPGRSVRIRLRADDSIELGGRIRQISPVVDTATGTVKVTVEARSVPAAVRPGAFVRIDVVRDTVEAAVLVPREAVVRELQKAYVFVATDDGVAEKRAISLGLEEDGRIEAKSGVAAGERVIVAGQGGLEDGASIQLLDAPHVEVATVAAAS